MTAKMIWTSQIPPPKPGDFKLVKRFAWVPKQIGDKRIWLHRYMQLYEWKIREVLIPVRNFPEVIKAQEGGWELVNEKIVSKKNGRRSEGP